MDDEIKTNNEKQGKLSICEVFKDDTSEVIQKLESTAPAIFQNYSNLYTSYLHMWSDFFGTCYISEKKFFDKLDIDPSILNQIKSTSETVKKMYLENIDNGTQFFDEYTKMRLSAIKSFDRVTHVMMESYANYLSQLDNTKN